MAQLTYGTKKQIQFNSNEEFYEAIGLLAKSDGTTSIHWERNEEQGAWGSEGRIHVLQNSKVFPAYFSRAFTAGTGNILFRINCNEFVQYIVSNHKFAFGKSQVKTEILSTIPEKYIPDFNRGLAL